MSNTLRIILLLFSLMFFIIISIVVKKGKMPIKYSLVWYVSAFVILFVSVVPGFLELFTKLLGFATISNLVIGVFLTLLLLITMILTIIVSSQKKQIKDLTQEISILNLKIK